MFAEPRKWCLWAMIILSIAMAIWVVQPRDEFTLNGYRKIPVTALKSPQLIQELNGENVWVTNGLGSATTLRDSFERPQVRIVLQFANRAIAPSIDGILFEPFGRLALDREGKSTLLVVGETRSNVWIDRWRDLVMGFSIAGIAFLAAGFVEWGRIEVDTIRQRRFQVGFCEHCGYDLRATQERCPECGKPNRRPAK